MSLDVAFSSFPALSTDRFHLRQTQLGDAEAFFQIKSEANPLARNSRSNNVLLRLGFTHEGTLRQRIFFRGVYEDQMYFGLLRKEWVKATVPRHGD